MHKGAKLFKVLGWLTEFEIRDPQHHTTEFSVKKLIYIEYNRG